MLECLAQKEQELLARARGLQAWEDEDLETIIEGADNIRDRIAKFTVEDKVGEEAHIVNALDIVNAFYTMFVIKRIRNEEDLIEYFPNVREIHMEEDEIL